MFSLSLELHQVFKQHADMALSIRKAAVLGAGIIGGGITFTIAQAQLDLTEAKRQLARQLKKEKITKALDLTAA